MYKFECKTPKKQTLLKIMEGLRDLMTRNRFVQKCIISSISVSSTFRFIFCKLYCRSYGWCNLYSTKSITAKSHYKLFAWSSIKLHSLSLDTSPTIVNVPKFKTTKLLDPFSRLLCASQYVMMGFASVTHH